MFYVKVEPQIRLTGKIQELGAEVDNKFGIKPGIHLVKDGFISGETGDARYWDYVQLFQKIPTYRAYWNDTSPINKISGKDYIFLDLFLENGLLLERGIDIQFHEVNYLSPEEGGTYLLLCSDRDNYFQVIARAE